MNSPDSHSDKPDIDGTAQDRIRASRRSAILSGLGKGSVALAALSPLASQASRSHKLFNPNLGTGTDCYCTVSGFQSAAISQIPAVTCGTFKPEHFIKKVGLGLDYVTLTNSFAGNFNGPNAPTYTATQITNGNGPTDLAKALNNYFGLAAGTISTQQASNFLNASGHPAITTSSGDLVLVRWLTSSTCNAYQGQNFGSDNALAVFSGVFGGSDVRTFIEVLNDTSSAKRYFLACWLSIGKSGISVPVDLTRTYVVNNYSDAIAADLGSNESLFFKAISNLD